MRGIFNVFIDHFVILWKYMNFWVDSFKRDLFHTSPIGFLVICDSRVIWIIGTVSFFGALSDPLKALPFHFVFITTLFCLKCFIRYPTITKSTSVEMYYRRKRVLHPVIIIGERDLIDFHKSYDLVYTDSPKLKQEFEKLGLPVDPVCDAHYQEADLILIGPEANYFGHARINKQIRIHYFPLNAFSAFSFLLSGIGSNGLVNSFFSALFRKCRLNFSSTSFCWAATTLTRPIS